MVRIAITQAAFDAIARTMPFGNVGYENKTGDLLHLLWIFGIRPAPKASAVRNIAFLLVDNSVARKPQKTPVDFRNCSHAETNCIVYMVNKALIRALG
jgi:hypothetical protein